MTPDEFDREVDQLEVNLDRLRALYEQYFLGIERIEPAVARKTVDRQFWALKRVTVRNTARRFRFQTLIQRYNTLQQHWMKVCRQIENGTYPRHVQRAKQRQQELATGRTRAVATPFEAAEPAAPAPEKEPLERGPTPSDLDKDEPQVDRRGTTPTSDPSPSNARPSRRISFRPISDDEAEKIRSSIPPAPLRPQRPAPPPLKREGKNKMPPQTRVQPPPPPAQNITDERVGGLYQELQRVRRRLNQEDMDVSIEALSRSLRATEARLKAKYAGKRVDFRVEVFNGKAVIKPTVKK